MNPVQPLADAAADLDENAPAVPGWLQVSWRRWTRIDGAAVLWDNRTPYANPSSPNGRMWTAWKPDPSEECLIRRSKNGLGFPRRWKSRESAMAAVDREYPLPSSRTSNL